MSYSFTLTAPSKVEAIALVNAELNRIVEEQPVHAADRDAAQGAAANMIALVRDEPDMDVKVSMWGSIVAPESGISHVSFGVDATLQPREGFSAS